MSKIDNKNAIRYGEQILKKVRTYYPLKSVTRAFSYRTLDDTKDYLKMLDKININKSAVVYENANPILKKMHKYLNDKSLSKGVCQQSKLSILFEMISNVFPFMKNKVTERAKRSAKTTINVINIAKRINSEREKLKKTGAASLISKFKFCLSKNKPAEFYGNCGEFANISTGIAQLNPLKGWHSYIALLNHRSVGHLDHSFMVLVNDSTHNKIMKASSAANVNQIISNAKELVVVDPWLDFVGNTQQAKQNFKSSFNNVLELPKDCKDKDLFFNVSKMVTSRDFRRITERKEFYFKDLKESFPHLNLASEI